MKVSVIIPAWNAEKYLEEAVESVFSTQYPELEILIVEDKSSDNTYKLAQTIEKKYPNSIRLFTTSGGSNKGAGAARNVGLKQATGEIVSFLDADDIYLPCRFNKSVSILVNNQDVDGVYEKTAIKVEIGGEAVTGWAPKGIMELQTKNSKNLLDAVIKGCWHTNAITLRKSVFTKISFFNTKLRMGQDIELWMKLAMLCNLSEGNSNEPVALYRRHKGNRVSPENSTQSGVPPLGYAVLFARRQHIPTQSINDLEIFFKQRTRARLGWLIENNKLLDAWICCYWIARLFPMVIFERNYLGNLKNLVIAKIRGGK